ncbi:hypothetical protein AAFF_G00207040 [Aldrovandia affinis]|uniref:Uncharacterized protein n=1 Tax=Aldrovandia affinis TaxID=143900 RepID=A0AAD7RHF7_9TELE|nr:hypothetical protein AAFF_G00207040 [Aldrovandia affinis]
MRFRFHALLPDRPAPFLFPLKTSARIAMDSPVSSSRRGAPTEAPRLPGSEPGPPRSPAPRLPAKVQTHAGALPHPTAHLYRWVSAEAIGGLSAVYQQGAT